jgi:DNA-binding transcriptional regulator YhcF (GntR family)
MTKPMIRIHNTETDEIIDREMTAAEFAKYEQKKLADEVKQTEIEAAANAKQSAIDKLAELGLTAEELAALLQ